MSSSSQKERELLPQLFRVEYTKMTAVLCRHFGLINIEIAEDIASETFLKASEYWPLKGIPDHPVAWLYTVAKNKAKDFIKREIRLRSKQEDIQGAGISANEIDFDFNQEHITDSVLAMIFAVCDANIPAESQICLALQVLGGFSITEIAQAFLSKTETIKKRLYRARNHLRTLKFQLSDLNEEEIKWRLETVLKTIYLLFSEGYFSKSGGHVIRKDLCAEAVRLAVILTEKPITNTPAVNALLALMCYQSSRLDARIDEQNELVRFEEQDRSLWNQPLINKGHFYLIEACRGENLSSYHLEASIAYWHTTEKEDKWQHILSLYDQLLQFSYSPPRMLNRLFAYGKVYSYEKAIQEALQLALNDHADYHELLAYFHTSIDTQKAVYHYQQAINLVASAAAKKRLQQAIKKIRTLKTKL